MSASAASRLNDDIQTLSAEVSEHLRDAADKTGDDAKAALERSAAALTKAAHRLSEDVRHTSRNMGAQAVAEVRDRPVATTALVAIAATLIGLVAIR
jgi:ElaB/YqjD/DUF883 family membrane-anchored ribosome-binding protein